MAVVPFIPPECTWLYSALVGQNWPAGDEDALRRAGDAWLTALTGVVELAGHGNDATLNVGSSVESMSADQFNAYWDQYTKGDGSALGELARQCQALVPGLFGQANEVEYTKLSIDVTIVLTAIQIIVAIASAFMTLGGSLAEIPLAVFIGERSVIMLLSRFLQMALMMLLPDLISQGWMLVVDHHESSWDGAKTKAALENALIAGTLATVGGAAVAKLPFMGEAFGKTFGGRLVQGLVHFGEGGAVNVGTAITTDVLSGQQLDAATLWNQFLQGGVLATAFYLPHLAVPHGAPLSFTAADGSHLQVVLGDTALEQFTANNHELPNGFSAPVFDDRGLKAGTATFGDGTVSFDRSIHGSTSVDLTTTGYTVGSHDGSLASYRYNADGQPELSSYVKPSDGTVVITTDQGTELTVPKGSMVHYSGDGAHPAADGGYDGGSVYRADIVDGSLLKGSTVTVWQAADPGGNLAQTGRIVHPDVLGLGSFFGVEPAKYYGTDGSLIGVSSPLLGKPDFTGQPAYHEAFGDRYAPFPADAHTSLAAVPAGPDHSGPFLLRSLFGGPERPAERPIPEVVFDGDHFAFREPEPAGPAPEAAVGTDAGLTERGQRLDALREFRAGQQADAASADGAQGSGQAGDTLPFWLTDRPSKILLVTTFFRDVSAGGVPVFNRELANAFAAAGHEVYVAVLDENLPAEAQVQANGVTFFTNAADLPPHVDVVIGHTRFSGQQAQEIRANFYPDAPLIHFQHMVPGGLGEAKAAAVIYQAPRVDSYEVVVVQGTRDGILTGRIIEVPAGDDPAIARLEDPLVVYGEQVMINGKPASVGAAFFYELRKAAANQEVEARLDRGADVVLGVGPAITKDASRLVGGGQTPLVDQVIPGFDFSRAVSPPLLDEHGLPPDGRYNVLLIGRADDPQKGALEAAHMIRQLRDSGMDVRLIIRGFDPNQPARMHAMADRLSELAGAPVDVRPFTPSIEDLTTDLSTAHLVIAPGSGEGFGMSAAGASAVGVPVLVPRTSGYGMFLADERNGAADISQRVIVEQGFPDQIPIDRWAASMRAVLTDLPGARARAEELVALLQSQDRTWHGTAAQVLDILRVWSRSRDTGGRPEPGTSGPQPAAGLDSGGLHPEDQGSPISRILNPGLPASPDTQ